MANLLDGLKDVIVEALRPGTRQESGELATLRQMYENDHGQGNMLPNKWYRLHNESGACVGFSFVCNCTKEWQLLSAFEWGRDYVCPTCKAKFDLYRFVGITDAEGKFRVGPKEMEARLATLPIRPRLAGRKSPAPFIDTWAGNDEIGYDGSASENSKRGEWV